jgi:hypothetical protein
MSKETLGKGYYENLVSFGSGKEFDRKQKKTQNRKPRTVAEAETDKKLKANAKANSKARMNRLMDEVKTGKKISKPKGSVYTKNRSKKK